MQSSLPTATLAASVSPFRLSLNAAAAIALAGSAFTLMMLFREITESRGASVLALFYYALSIAIVVIAWRMLSSAAAMKDFVVTGIYAAAFVLVVWLLCETVILGTIIRFCLLFNIEKPFTPPGLGQYIYRVLGYDVQLAVMTAGLLAGWKLRSAK